MGGSLTVNNTFVAGQRSRTRPTTTNVFIAMRCQDFRFKADYFDIHLAILLQPVYVIANEVSIRDIEHYETIRYLMSNLNSIYVRNLLNISNYIWNYILRYPGADEHSIVCGVIRTA